MRIILEQFDLLNTAILVMGLLATYTIFNLIYLRLGEEFIKPDFKITTFEKEFWKKFLSYVPWAAFQQGILLTLLYLIKVDDLVKYALAVMIFTIIHIPNFKLMGFTAAFGIVFYGLWFAGGGFSSFPYIVLLHAFGGTAFYKTGWDMRVLRF